MTTNRKYISHLMAFVVGVMVMLWFKGCSSDCGNSSTNVKVTVPEVKGSFKPKQPNHFPIVSGQKPTGQNLSKSDKSKNEPSNNALQFNDSLISEFLAENEKLSRDFYFANDSLKKLKYDKAIQLNLFSETFEDNNIKIDMSGIVRGEVKSIQPFYTIKEKKIDVPVPVTKFRLLAGGGVGNSIDFQKPIFSANIGFQNKKGNIIRAGYDTEKRILIGYDFSIFSIKK